MHQRHTICRILFNRIPRVRSQLLHTFLHGMAIDLYEELQHSTGKNAYQDLENAFRKTFVSTLYTAPVMSKMYKKLVAPCHISGNERHSLILKVARQYNQFAGARQLSILSEFSAGRIYCGVWSKQLFTTAQWGGEKIHLSNLNTRLEVGVTGEGNCNLYTAVTQWYSRLPMLHFATMLKLLHFTSLSLNVTL